MSSKKPVWMLAAPLLVAATSLGRDYADAIVTTNEVVEALSSAGRPRQIASNA